MKGKLIAIDGACRRPGKPDCLAIGACVVKDLETGKIESHEAACETESTAQRGEILGLIQALEKCINIDAETFYIVSDSEYVVNCMNKEWYINWMIS